MLFRVRNIVNSFSCVQFLDTSKQTDHKVKHLRALKPAKATSSNFNIFFKTVEKYLTKAFIPKVVKAPLSTAAAAHGSRARRDGPLRDRR